MTLLFLFRLILSDMEIIQEMWRELILLRYCAIRLLQLNPSANARNIVGQQLLTLLDVTCCVRLHTLLHVVGSCRAKFETGQTFSYVATYKRTQQPSQQCWELLANNVVSDCTGLYSGYPMYLQEVLLFSR